MSKSLDEMCAREPRTGVSRHLPPYIGALELPSPAPTSAVTHRKVCTFPLAQGSGWSIKSPGLH